MSLSSDLVSQFVKATKDETDIKQESTHYGTIVINDDGTFVRLDGSELSENQTLTPITTTTEVKDGERVTVSIKNHTATVTGNITAPAARNKDVVEIAGNVEEINSDIDVFNTIIAHKVTTEDLSAVNGSIDNLTSKLINVDKLNAAEADIKNLEADFANIETLNAAEADIIKAHIDNLEATFGTFTDLEAEDLKALNAEITNLRGHIANFNYLSTDALSAIKAEIKDLDVTNLDAKYANIDFANIGEAAIENIYAGTGLIKDLTYENGTITGELAAVTINADTIKTGTLATDRLLVKGENGLYYKLNVPTEGDLVKYGEITPEEAAALENGIHGSNIIAQSITADQIKVSDLVAFDATIGGFEISDDSIHSLVKDSVDNTTRGIYMDNEGQFAVGDKDNFLKYYKDENGNYKLSISTSSGDLETVLKDAKDAADAAKDAAAAIEELEQKVETGDFSGEDAYSVVLSSESHTFPGSEYAAFASSVTTQVVALKGSELVAASVRASEIEVISEKAEYVTVSVDNANLAPEITISVTDEVNTGGTVKIPVHIGDITINKEFSFAVALRGATGPQGEKGETGAAGSSQYIHIKYSDDGTTFTENNGETIGAYIGILVDNNKNDSDDFSKYTWSKFTEDVDNVIAGLEKELQSQTSKFDVLRGEILSEVSDTYVGQSEYLKYKEDVSSSIQQTAESLSATFLTKENIEDLRTSTADLSEQLKQYATYFTFDTDGLHIAKSGAEVQTLFTNNSWQFVSSDDVLLTIAPNGVYADSFHIGDIIFQKQSDGSVVIS